MTVTGMDAVVDGVEDDPDRWVRPVGEKERVERAGPVLGCASVRVCGDEAGPSWAGSA